MRTLGVAVASVLLLQQAAAFLPIPMPSAARAKAITMTAAERGQEASGGLERRAVLGQLGSVLGGLGALSLLPSTAAAKGVKVSGQWGCPVVRLMG